jgi:23S rRNA (uracil1939-C5)-methyltransferase
MNKNKKIDNRPQPEPANIHGLSHDGRGIATIQSKTTFIAGALPDESVTYRIHQKKTTYMEGEAIDILKASPDRVTPPCQHFGLCGGCSLQHMSVPMQTQLKEKTLLEQLTHFGKVTPGAILPPLQSAGTGYRRKARLGVKFVIKKNKLLVGFREKSSRYLADLSRCAVLHPEVGERLDILAELVRSLDCYQQLPQIEVAMGDTTVGLVFRHMEPLTDSDHEKLCAFGKQYGFHLYLQPNPPQPVTKLYPTDGPERLTYTLPDYQLEFLFHPLDFTQINLEMNRLMVKQAVDLLELTENDSVLDLFCGIGNFTLPMARAAKEVIGVEGGVEMTIRAKDNAVHNDIHNTQFHAANLMLPPTDAPWMNRRFDKILLDPPRAGAKEMLSAIAGFQAKRIVYVSCNPATLARDAGELVHQYGYQLQKVGIMNMFPHTSHIEAMAVFVKK